MDLPNTSGWDDVMKKLILIMAVSVLSPMPQANAECGSGFGNAVEVNATTQKVTYSCIKLPDPPTQEQIVEKVKTDLSQIITNNKNANPVQVINPEIVTVQPKIDLTLPRPNKIEVNVTTQVTTISELNDQEFTDYQIRQANGEAIVTAKNQAVEKSQGQVGTKQCVNWVSGDQAGQECNVEPIPATTEEIDYSWQIIKEWLNSDSFQLWTNWWSL